MPIGRKMPNFGTNVSFFRKKAEIFGKHRGKIPKIGAMELRIIQIMRITVLVPPKAGSAA